MSRLTRRETSWVTAFRRFIVAATSAGTCYHARDYVTYGGAAFATGRINFFENINGASKIRSLQADLRQAKRITRRIISVTSFAFFFSIDFSFVFHDLWVASVPRAIVWHSFPRARGFYLSISILKKKEPQVICLHLRKYYYIFLWHSLPRGDFYHKFITSIQRVHYMVELQDSLWNCSRLKPQWISRGRLLAVWNNSSMHALAQSTIIHHHLLTILFPSHCYVTLCLLPSFSRVFNCTEWHVRVTRTNMRNRSTFLRSDSH